MKIFVKVKPAAKENIIEKTDDENFIVSVKEPPVKGRANAAVVESLANYFDVSKSDVKILTGHFSRNKIIEILI